MNTAPIGVFDSGMGGLSVLSALRAALPSEHFVYYGDNAHAPYGPRDAKEVICFSRFAAQKLMERGIKALIIACNTASSASLEILREELPVPVFGLEPELRRAREVAGEKGVLVLATEGTLHGALYRRALECYCPEAVGIPAPEAVLMVERGVLDGREPEAYFAEKFAPYAAEEIGAVVLGCTHFPFLKKAISRAMPGTPLLDGNERLLSNLCRTLRGDLCVRGEGTVEILSSSKDERVLRRMHELFEQAASHDFSPLERALWRNKALFSAGALNCAETVLSTTLEVWGLELPFIPQIATPFGGGMGAMRSTCGACTGALMAIGIALGRKPGGDREPAYSAAQAFLRWMNAEYGTHDCGELIHQDPANPEKYRDSRLCDTHETVCRPLIERVVRYLVENIHPK